MINNVTLMGRLTAIPELKRTQSGTSVTSFNIAVDRNYQKQGEEKKTDFITCVAWRNTADFITKWFGKGDTIAVTGEIQTRNYEDKNGNKRTAVEVLVNQASFCGGKSNGGKSDTNAKNDAPTFSNNTDYEEIDYGDDDLPF